MNVGTMCVRWWSVILFTAIQDIQIAGKQWRYLPCPSGMTTFDCLLWDHLSPQDQERASVTVVAEDYQSARAVSETPASTPPSSEISPHPTTGPHTNPCECVYTLTVSNGKKLSHASRRDVSDIGLCQCSYSLSVKKIEQGFTDVTGGASLLL